MVRSRAGRGRSGPLQVPRAKSAVAPPERRRMVWVVWMVWVWVLQVERPRRVGALVRAEQVPKDGLVAQVVQVA